VTPSGAVDEIIDELADELVPPHQSSAATQPNAVATNKVRLRMIERPIANMVR
jgi:hypothetical protein